MRTLKPLHIALLGALLAALVTGAILIFGQGGPAATQAPVPALTTTDTQRLESGLTAPAPAAQAEVLAAAVRPAYLEAGRSALPPGATIRLDEATFVAGEGGLAEVEAQVDGGAQAGRWRLQLVFEDGRWLIYATSRLR